MRRRTEAFGSNVNSAPGLGVLRYLRLFLLLAIGVPALVACGGGGGGGSGSGETVSRVEVTPVSPSLSAGTARQLVATAVYSSGRRAIVTTSSTWTSSAPSTATVGDSAGTKGRVTGVAVGTASITATFNGVAGSTTATITPAVTLTRVEIAPASPSIAKGTTLPLAATAVYSDGTTATVTSTATWASETPANVTVGNTAGLKGRIFGAQVGTAVITATYNSVTGRATATVTAATPVGLALSPTRPTLADGTTTQMTATATFTDGSTQNVSESSEWASSAPSFASVSNTADSKGLVTAVAKGSATVTAEFMSLSANTTITVTDAVAVRVSVTPPNPSVPRGTTQQFDATLIFSDDSTQDVTTTATWASSDTIVGTVGNSTGTKGLAAAKAEGTTSISATASGMTGSTTMTVSAAAITSIDVTPKGAQVPEGFERAFTATAVLSDGTTRDVTADVAWSTNESAFATISNADGSKGRAKGEAPGSTTVLAQSGNIQGSTTLTVTDATLASIEVTPANPAVPIGLDQQFTATGTFSDASVEEITTQVTWASSTQANATISNDDGSKGLATAVAAGTSTISASRAGTLVTGSTTMTVSEAALVSIAVSPAEGTVPSGLTTDFTAEGTYSDGSTQDITSEVTWSALPAANATISNAADSRGQATGGTPGTATITATLDGKSGTATLTVTAAELQSIAVTPALPEVPLGLHPQFTATGTYSDGSTVAITDDVTWASSAPAVATISNAAGSHGLADTLTQGKTTISATRGAISGSTELTVTAVAPVSLTVTPDDPDVPRGTTQQLVATANYSDGTTQVRTGNVTWSSSNPAVAGVSNAAGSQGRVNAIEVGTTIITALDPVSNLSDTVTVRVTAAALTGIVVTPANAKLPAGFGFGYTATGNYSDGSSQDITSQVSWTSLDTAKAVIGNSASTKGVVSGLSAGETSIVAKLGAITGQTGLTVTGETLASIAVTPGTKTLTLGQTQQYQAQGTFSGATVLDITTQVIWASSNTSAATISNAAGSKGLATAGLVPTSTTTISATRNGVTGTATLTRGAP